MKPSKLAAAVVLIATLTSCTSFRAYQRARDLEIQEDWDGAVEEYAKALTVDPQNVQYRIGLQRARLEASRQHFEKGKTLRAAGQNELAAIEFQLTVKLDPTNQFAAVELSKSLNELDAARRVADSNSIDEVKRRAITKAQPPMLNPASEEPISLSFPRETPVKDIYRALGNAFGINILFDGGVKDDRITIELRDVTAQQALERLMQAANHFYKVLDEKTIIVVPDNPQARRDYEDLVIRTFYLSNGDAEQVTNVVRTMIEARNVFPLKALNAITIRDTADKVRIAEKIIEANDKARAEVVVDVELLQLDIGKLREMGIDITGLSGSAVVLKADGTPRTGPFTISDFRSIAADTTGFNLPSASYKFIKSGSNGKLLAKPQLRISEGEKAMLTIGERVPVPVSTFSSINPGGNTTYQPVTSYQYQDVGIKITMEPRVHHNREVTLKMTVEVSNLSREVSGGAGQPAQPVISTRTIDSTIRLKDGETNFLAGLIRRDDTNTDSGVPFLGDIPLIGRLFKQTKNTHGATDLVLTTTPHIIRIPDITEDDLAPMWVGTTNNLTFRGVSPRIESPSAADPFAAERGNEAFRQATPARAGDFPRAQEAQPNPVYLPPGAAPSDPFNLNPPAPLPAPVEDAPEVIGDPQSKLNSRQSQSSNAPRIAPQPSTLILKSGEARRWAVVGMDLENMRTPQLQLRFDTSTLMVEEVTFGAALRVDPTAPPAITIDQQGGLITIKSTNGEPLQFDMGGEILSLHVRGANAGDSFLVLDGFNLQNAQGEPVAAYISGGRTRVQ